MLEAVQSPYLVPFDGSFELKQAQTTPPDKDITRKQYKKILRRHIDALDDLQRQLYAQDRYSVLLIFQAMDAAGKDSTIRAVMRGVNPAGTQVYSFKQPSKEELDHDFLWRTASRLPERGRIGIFNRSYYEEVLVVRVHPEYLGGQRVPIPEDLNTLWQHRFDSIRSHEEHLANNGTLILKFWLNVSREEQKQRFLSRIEEPSKNWKFSSSDITERQLWPDYMDAYESALNATSRPGAPWYAIPADNKPFMRQCVAEIIVQSMAQLGLAYPKLGAKERAKLDAMREQLLSES